ncbi:alpha/beta hydrolase [Microbacterium lushaniae]|nr:alpha/beta hydrolase [Microbacterium lushaniae]KAA9158480.1 alpha/beta hydrolase [Microbacterium lushaniae]
MPTVRSGGTVVSWEEIGAADGRPVLVVHGFASNSAQNWRRSGWETALADAGLRGIAVDLRGHGSSARPAGPDNYRAALLVTDLVAVLDAAGADEAGYLGYSLGSRLGWMLALAQPRRVRRLVLGGFGPTSPLAEVDLEAARAAVFRGTPILHPPTAALVSQASLVPGNDVGVLLDVAEGVGRDTVSVLPADPAPAAPMCIVNGDRDTIAAGGEALARAVGAHFVPVAGRSHTSAVSSRTFKEAATAWLTR